MYNCHAHAIFREGPVCPGYRLTAKRCESRQAPAHEDVLV
jgi:hypothetical protein